jgi:hypothetical protein
VFGIPLGIKSSLLLVVPFKTEPQPGKVIKLRRGSLQEFIITLPQHPLPHSLKAFRDFGIMDNKKCRMLDAVGPGLEPKPIYSTYNAALFFLSPRQRTNQIEIKGEEI